MDPSPVELLARMEVELKPLVPVLGQAADTIMDEGVSKYPIFVTYQMGVNMGIPLIDKDVHGGKWSINASTLEEFATKNLIQMEKVEDFKDVYKPVENYLCLFVLSELGATFVFLTRN